MRHLPVYRITVLGKIGRRIAHVVGACVCVCVCVCECECVVLLLIPRVPIAILVQVVAWWEEDVVWLPATVFKIYQNGTVKVQWEDASTSKLPSDYVEFPKKRRLEPVSYLRGPVLDKLRAFDAKLADDLITCKQEMDAARWLKDQQVFMTRRAEYQNLMDGVTQKLNRAELEKQQAETRRSQRQIEIPMVLAGFDLTWKLSVQRMPCDN